MLPFARKNHLWQLERSRSETWFDFLVKCIFVKRKENMREWFVLCSIQNYEIGLKSTLHWHFKWLDLRKSLMKRQVEKSNIRTIIHKILSLVAQKPAKFDKLACQYNVLLFLNNPYNSCRAFINMFNMFFYMLQPKYNRGKNCTVLFQTDKSQGFWRPCTHICTLCKWANWAN